MEEKSKPAPFDETNPKGCGTRAKRREVPRLGDSLGISGELAVDFPAVTDTENQDKQPIILNLADEPVIAHAVFPELPEP